MWMPLSLVQNDCLKLKSFGLMELVEKISNLLTMDSHVDFSGQSYADL